MKLGIAAKYATMDKDGKPLIMFLSGALLSSQTRQGK